MPFPLLLAAGLAGMGISTAANLYTQYNQRKLYSRQSNAYMNLHRGYETYLAKHGRSINPDRAWTSYYGKAQLADTNYHNSLVGSIGTLAGGLGATSMLSRPAVRQLYAQRYGMTSRWL